jgi:hypothetical protein
MTKQYFICLRLCCRYSCCCNPVYLEPLNLWRTAILHGDTPNIMTNCSVVAPARRLMHLLGTSTINLSVGRMARWCLQGGKGVWHADADQGSALCNKWSLLLLVSQLGCLQTFLSGFCGVSVQANNQTAPHVGTAGQAPGIGVGPVLLPSVLPWVVLIVLQLW